MRTATWAGLAVSILMLYALLVPASGAAQSAIDGEWQIGSSASSPRLTINGRLFSGHTGCRPFSAHMQGSFDRGRVLISPLAGHCTAPQQRSEDRFLLQMRNIYSLSLRDNQLEARNPRGALLFSARRQVPRNRVESLLGPDGRWRPVTLLGQPAQAIAGAHQTVRISGTELLIEGYCNEYSASVSFGPATNGSGSFGLFVTNRTERMCAELHREAGDADLLAAIENASSYRLIGQEMHLMDRTGNVTGILWRM
jgi:heat shock protein HslJ